MDDANDEIEISNVFASQYNALYNSVPYDMNKMNVLKSELDDRIVKICKSGACEHNHVISEAQVRDGIKRLKPNKTDGDSGHNSSHLLNSVSHNSSVYATFLDASKAFDRVKYDNLFFLLLERNICPMVARFLCFMYTHQKCRIKWSNSHSKSFDIKNGVKQGGVLSPMLFNIYIDVLLNRLKHSGIGCQIAHNYFGSLAYVDDIFLLWPNISSLNTMLKICETFSDEYKILFNASKSKLVVFGNDSNCTDVFLQGNVIVKTKVEKHVGNLVGSDFNIKSQVAQNACNQLYGKVNLLIRQMGACNCFILYKLFKNYCMSFYGCQLWNYSAFKVVNTVYVAWRKCVKRILKLPLLTVNYYTKYVMMLV